MHFYSFFCTFFYFDEEMDILIAFEFIIINDISLLIFYDYLSYIEDFIMFLFYICWHFINSVVWLVVWKFLLCQNLKLSWHHDFALNVYLLFIFIFWWFQSSQFVFHVFSHLILLLLTGIFFLNCYTNSRSIERFDLHHNLIASYSFISYCWMTLLLSDNHDLCPGTFLFSKTNLWSQVKFILLYIYCVSSSKLLGFFTILFCCGYI